MAQIYSGKAVHHEEFGTGRVVNVEDTKVTVNFIKAGIKFFSRDDADAKLNDPPYRHDDEDDEVDTDSLKEAIREVLREEGMIGTIELAEKWDGGEMIMKPGKPGLQEKAVPIETFFHKIVMVRNQLRVLEQNINSNAKLTDSEKVDLQQYITRCYGSLTTFNVLFADKNDWFVGAKKE